MLPQCILPLSDEKSYKGSSGRIGILGGSALYTGAPHYAATAALQTGADLVTIFTAHEASIPLKCYSPEFMVQSVYRAQDFDAFLVLPDRQPPNDNAWTVDTIPELLSQSPAAQRAVDSMVETVVSGVERCHALVVGPGLGRCPLVGYAVALILQRVRLCAPHMPVLLDADALWFVSQSVVWRETVVRAGEASIIMTPNVMEYRRLRTAADDDSKGDDSWAAKATLLRKSATDLVCVGFQSDDAEKEEATIVWRCIERGGRKRSGGIGDVLAGTMGTLAAWQGILVSRQGLHPQVVVSNTWIPAAWTACHLVKRATCQAYNRKRRSMTAPDILEDLGGVFDEMIGQDYNE
jgi:ATP-dependent NAD(P)H-hydrate dehydratase